MLHIESPKPFVLPLQIVRPIKKQYCFSKKLQRERRAPGDPWIFGYV